ncbi:MAG: PilZ domain-containing protein [Anaerolineales bacterium]|nr:PilZ domain-containing protein [Anaerolineales bacterium]
MANNKRKKDRRDFTYYMQVKDDSTKQIIGYLSDISTGGFKLDCQQQIPTGKDFHLLIDLTAEVADKTSMTFIARSKWCHPDHIDPTSFNVGFEIVNMAPGDMVIFNRIFEKYGAETAKRKGSDSYLWGR